MRAATRWTSLRYRLRRLGDRLVYWWVCLCAAIEELSILLGRRHRIEPPPRRGLHVRGRSPRQAAHRMAVDPRFAEPRATPNAPKRGEA